MSSTFQRRKRYYENPFKNELRTGAAKVNKRWLNRHILSIAEDIINNESSSSDLQGGVYVGIAGSAYGVYQAARLFPEIKRNFVEFVSNSIDRQFKSYTANTSDIGYLLGRLGVYVVRAIIDFESGKIITDAFLKDMQHFSQRFSDKQFVKADEMLVGRAGFIAAILTLRMRLKHIIIPDSSVSNVLETMISSGREYSHKKKFESPLMYQYHGVEYLGAAHGLMGILQMLLSFAHLLDSSALKDVETSLNWLISTQLLDGNFPSNLSEINGRSELIHWCHGATGAVHLLIVAYNVFKDKKYLKCIERCLNLIWEKGVLIKGPGICHGIAGSGYAFLLYYRLTRIKEFLDKALCFGFMIEDEFICDQTKPDCPFSLYEGLAGSLCFLCDLKNPDNAQFPLIPIVFP